MFDTIRHPILTARAVHTLATMVLENSRNTVAAEKNDEHEVIEGTVQNKIVHAK